MILLVCAASPGLVLFAALSAAGPAVKEFGLAVVDVLTGFQVGCLAAAGVETGRG